MHLDRVVAIVTSYGMDDRGVGFLVPVGSIIFLLTFIQTGSVAHPTPYPMGTGPISPRGKHPGREADHSLATSAEAKKMWIYTSTPTFAFMA
jgi:hypothetical protein